MPSNMENTKPFNILFLCPANAARSIMAEAITNRLYGNRFRAFSAGSHPKGAVDPYTTAALVRAGFDVTGLRSKSWDEFTGPDAPALDFVFIVNKAIRPEACPQWPGQPMVATWEILDPNETDGGDVMKHLAFTDTFRMLCNRIGAFAALNQQSLDRLAVQSRIEESRRIAASAAA